MSKKNKKENITENQTQLTRRKSNLDRLREMKEREELSRRERRRRITLIVISALLAAALIAGTVILTVVLVRRSFDYEKSNLSKYVYISRDAYTDYALDLFIDQVTDEDVENALMKSLISLKGDARENGAAFTDVTIGYGDVVHLWYRGYMEDGTEPAGTNNMHADNYESLEIGSQSFISGFESGLVGINPKDFPRFTRTMEGTLLGNEILYVTMTAIMPDGSSFANKSVRLDLSNPTALDETYGLGFSVAFKDRELGSSLNITTVFPKMPEVANAATYSVTLDFVATGDTDPVVVTTYFPYDYTEPSLAGKTVSFEVFIDSVVDYEMPEINDELIGKLGYTAEELEAFQGDTLVEKYRDLIRANLELTYEKKYDELLSNAVWEHFLKEAEIKRLPKYPLNVYYKRYLAELNAAFEDYGGSYGYTTVEEFAPIYLDIEKGADYKAALKEKAKNTVTEELLLYYIARAEDLLLTKDEKREGAKPLMEEYLEYYLSTFPDMDRDKYDTEEAYQKAVETLRLEMLDYYGGEEFFEELANYNAIMNTLKKYAKVKITGRLNTKIK